jgi:hypothetical protein
MKILYIIEIKITFTFTFAFFAFPAHHYAAHHYAERISLEPPHIMS